MAEQEPKDIKVSESFSECLQSLLPNCTRALELCDTGIRRELSLKERILLSYHGQLCPYCGCAEGKFRSARERMSMAVERRQSREARP